MAGTAIAAIDAVPESGSFLFRIEAVETGEEREAILLRTDGGVVGWLNYCRHFTHVELDKGDGAIRRDGEVLCPNHGAMFDVTTGRCTHGPCEGAVLVDVDVRTEDGAVHLADDDYRFAGTGPIDDGGDRTSTSNVEF